MSVREQVHSCVASQGPLPEGLSSFFFPVFFYFGVTSDCFYVILILPLVFLYVNLPFIIFFQTLLLIFVADVFSFLPLSFFMFWLSFVISHIYLFSSFPIFFNVSSMTLNPWSLLSLLPYLFLYVCIFVLCDLASIHPPSKSESIINSWIKLLFFFVE